MTSETSRAFQLLVIVTWSVLAITACGDRSYAVMEARQVFERATLPGSGPCWTGESRRLAEAFEASCQFTLSGEWSDYKRWVRGNIRPYEERSENQDSITFSKTTEGDVYTVRAELVKDNPTKSVRLVFRAAPW